MKIKPRLHHYCQNIAKGHLQDIVEMYGLLNFKIVYSPPNNDSWIMVGQNDLRFAIQIAEVSNRPIADMDEKRQTHIAFISDDPKGVIDGIKSWAEAKGLRFRYGQWSDIEMFFDLPDIFVNFVVEVMHTSIEKS